MWRFKTLLFASTFLATAHSAAAGVKTSVMWGADRTVTPNSICLYDTQNVCQPIFTLPATGGGSVFPASSVLLTQSGGVSLSVQQYYNLQPLTPQFFGAACDGVTDDSTPLQKWLNTLTSRLGGFIPTGPFCAFKTPLAGPTTTNGVSIRGNGLGSSGLLYTGASTTVTPLTFGQTTGSCSMSSLTLAEFSISSTTTMTGGGAIQVNDVCALRITDVGFEDSASGAEGNWFNGLVIAGGNQVYLNGNTITGSNEPIVAFGDTSAYGSTQLTDLWIGGKGIIFGGLHGINIAGNVGGYYIDNVSLLNNQTQLRISQDRVAIPNLQGFLGSTAILDVTRGPGTGHDIDIADPGGQYSELNISGTWIASAQGGGACVVIESGAFIDLTWTGGKLVSCGGDGFQQNSTTAIVNMTGVSIDMWPAPSSGYSINCTVANQSIFIKDVTFRRTGSSGLYSSYCTPQSYTTLNNPAAFSGVIQENVLYPLNGWQYDVSGQSAVHILNGSSAALTVGSGVVVLRNQTNGDEGMYLCGGGTCSLIKSTLGTWVDLTTTPAAGYMSLAYNSGNYTIFNNYGGAGYVNTNVMQFRNGSTN